MRKVRLTGGEPLVRRNLETPVTMLADIDGIEDLTLTTNASLLDPALGVGVLLLLGGGLALGLGLGGFTLPRTEAVASQTALLTGGGVSVVLGGLIGLSRLLGYG